MTGFNPQVKIAALEQRIRELEKNSHPPISFVDALKQAIADGDFDDVEIVGNRLTYVTTSGRKPKR